MKWHIKEKQWMYGGCMLIMAAVGNMNLLNTPENRQISERIQRELFAVSGADYKGQGKNQRGVNLGWKPIRR